MIDYVNNIIEAVVNISVTLKYPRMYFDRYLGVCISTGYIFSYTEDMKNGKYIGK